MEKRNLVTFLEEIKKLGHENIPIELNPEKENNLGLPNKEMFRVIAYKNGENPTIDLVDKKGRKYLGLESENFIPSGGCGAYYNSFQRYLQGFPGGMLLWTIKI